MSIDKRLSRLETNQDHRGPTSDEDVLKAIEMGQVDDRHVDWIDNVARPELLTTLCVWALALRYGRSEGHRDPHHFTYGIGIGASVLATPAGEPISLDLEDRVRSPIFTELLPDRSASEVFFAGAEDPRLLAGMWLRSRLVSKVIESDLGRALRMQLDRYERQPEPHLLPFDALRPPDHRLARVARFGAALSTLRADLEFPLDPELRGEVARLAESPTKAEE